MLTIGDLRSLEPQLRSHQYRVDVYARLVLIPLTPQWESWDQDARFYLATLLSQSHPSYRRHVNALRRAFLPGNGLWRVPWVRGWAWSRASAEFSVRETLANWSPQMNSLLGMFPQARVPLWPLKSRPEPEVGPCSEYVLFSYAVASFLESTREGPHEEPRVSDTELEDWTWSDPDRALSGEYRHKTVVFQHQARITVFSWVRVRQALLGHIPQEILPYQTPQGLLFHSSADFEPTPQDHDLLI